MLREFEAEQIELLGEAARSDFVKREPMTKETEILVAYLHDELFVGRKEEKLAEVKEVVDVTVNEKALFEAS